MSWHDVRNDIDKVDNVSEVLDLDEVTSASNELLITAPGAGFRLHIIYWEAVVKSPTVECTLQWENASDNSGVSPVYGFDRFFGIQDYNLVLPENVGLGYTVTGASSGVDLRVKYKTIKADS